MRLVYEYELEDDFIEIQFYDEVINDTINLQNLVGIVKVDILPIVSDYTRFVFPKLFQTKDLKGDYFYLQSITVCKFDCQNNFNHNKGYGSQMLKEINTVLIELFPNVNKLLCLEALEITSYCSIDKLRHFYNKNGFRTVADIFKEQHKVELNSLFGEAYDDFFIKLI